MENTKNNLRREIGTLGLTANIINIIIGAGIFVLPAIVAANLGSASIVAYIFCGIIVVLMMLCFAEVGSQITETGGIYTYIERSFGDYFGFLTAYLFLFSNIAGTGAVVNAIIEIIFELLPSIKNDIVRILFFFTIFFGFAYINVKGLKKGVGFVKAITFIKIVPLLLLVFLGMKDVSVSNLYWESMPSFSDISAAVLVLFFAFDGTGSALSVSGEVKRPQKTIPRAILLSVLIITVLYILIQTVAQGTLGASLPQFLENPLAEVASISIGTIGFTLITIGAAVSMFGNISSKVLSSPRIIFAASKDAIIPIKSLSRVHKKFATPHVAIITYASLCFLFASVGGFRQLAVISSATSLLVALGISIAVIKLRREKSKYETNEIFRIPGGYTIPILSSLSILWILSSLSQNKIIGIVIAVLALTVIYFAKLKLRSNRDDRL